ncbi:band 7 protein AGAP004871-like isoform X2 [Paramacrobiotus metropolitanus]|uniref:band 7 protein AGAP004871-like isoform X2 n=1 Tax=Paramacrobiotus metropolitanus TaxID=2943436 RepID=UPI0024464196|nr:band 7 protein AGAP004871-like isoform X2 [Paramacrobiotus metropolitanus]
MLHNIISESSAGRSLNSYEMSASHTNGIVGDPAYKDKDSSDHTHGFCASFLTFLSWILVVLTFPFSLCVCFKVVQEYERAVIFRLGRLLHGGSKEEYTKIDMRSTLFEIPPQEILTRDSVTVSVDAVVYYRISDATLSVANVENVHHSTRLLAQTTLRNVLGTKDLHGLLSDREIISSMIQNSLLESTDAWGIKVERVEIKDVRLPVQLQRAMAAEAEAAREARAMVIAAEGEQKASRALKEAADVIGESPGAMQLRYLQTLNMISAEKNSTIVFPIPLDMISTLMKTHL